jgi:hypothetical protein
MDPPPFLSSAPFKKVILVPRSFSFENGNHPYTATTKTTTENDRTGKRQAETKMTTKMTTKRTAKMTHG